MDPTIYQRTFSAMALYSERFCRKPVYGLLIFTSAAIDPKTEPWQHFARTGEHRFQVIYLKEELEGLVRGEPEHPLAAVFTPYLIEDVGELRGKSRECYQILQKANLPAGTRETLIDVFVYWMLERFENLSYKEVQAMIGKMTPLEETRAYKELVALGHEKGREQGLEQGREQGLEQGREQGLEQGREQGRVLGAIGSLEHLLANGMLTEQQYQQEMEPLKKKLADLMNSGECTR